MAKRKKESHSAAITTALIGVAGVVLGTLVTHWLGANKDRETAARAAHAERLKFYQTLQVHLDASDAAYRNQADLRERLVESLERRHGPRDMPFEPWFRKLYSKMNEKERSLCNQMRGLTDTLHSHNSAVRDLLNANPRFYGETPDLRRLYEHLDLWIAKYNHPFKETENACLVYVGVAENKPFPEGIGKQVEKILDELRSAPKG